MCSNASGSEAGMTPDRRRDVMVYQVAMVDAIGGAPLGDRWTVWVGVEGEGAFDSEAAAVACALELAAEHGRPAWLVTEGGAVAL